MCFQRVIFTQFLQVYFFSKEIFWMDSLRTDFGPLLVSGDIGMPFADVFKLTLFLRNSQKHWQPTDTD